MLHSISDKQWTRHTRIISVKEILERFGLWITCMFLERTLQAGRSNTIVFMIKVLGSQHDFEEAIPTKTADQSSPMDSEILMHFPICISLAYLMMVGIWIYWYITLFHILLPHWNCNIPRSSVQKTPIFHELHGIYETIKIWMVSSYSFKRHIHIQLQGNIHVCTRFIVYKDVGFEYRFIEGYDSWKSAFSVSISYADLRI